MLSVIRSFVAVVGAAALARARRAVRRLPAATLACVLATAVLARPYGACAMAQQMAHLPAGQSDDCSHEQPMPGHPGHAGHMCCLCCGPACCACAPPPTAQATVAVAPVHTIQVAAPIGGDLLPRAAAPFRQPPPIGPPPASATTPRITSVSS
jgi:hypothetical protein